MLRIRLSATVGVAAVLLTGSASALGPEGTPIDTSNYTIDFYQGPILASSRTIGLGGSFGALTEGVIGYSVNPASVAMRAPWSSTWFDWELDGSLTSPASIRDTDFDNNGDETFANDAALYITLGGGLQYGEIGLGLSVDSSEHQVRSLDDANAELSVELSRVDLVFGNVFLGGELAAGTGLALHAIGLLPRVETEGAPPGAAVQGAAWTFGVVWQPATMPLRAGGSLRVALPDDETPPDGVSADEDGNYVAQGYVFPSRIVAPTQFHFAIATQLFAPLNARWRIPRSRHAPPTKKEPSIQAARSRLLVSTAIEITLPTHNGVGIESFLRQQVERSGEEVSFSPRFGVEGEVVPGLLVLRSGTYIEPTRFRKSARRPHATAGFDVPLPLRWSVFGLFDENTTFRLGGAVDRSERYFGWSAGIGIWH